ncbi:tyrosine-protein phosphatase [Fluviispira vulneris]|uniref:tyrosine-protein phosphatase n=1 Tax=Fluviispira vulneris TaxID=2763012 RepID=UPI001649330F|nr:tyrosine-protein phosphatase [Fluviispira vulneris]
MSKKKKILIAFSSVLVIAAVLASFIGYIYKRDKNKYEPKLWVGLLDYRLNFRDLGESLNKCLKKDIYKTGLVYRSNKYFSGWSCDRIKNPDKIYSLNFSPSDPHAYYCEKEDGTRLFGSHPNTDFVISDIENLENWKKPEFKNSMCQLFKSALDDITQNKSFLFHCDVGRDRTGTFAAMIAMMLSEKKNIANENVIESIECDYEKTTALESFKKGRMENFLKEMVEQGGVSEFIQTQCDLSSDLIVQAADNFIK